MGTPFGLRQFYKTSEHYLTGLQAKEYSTYGAFCDLVLKFNTSNGLILEVAAGAGQASSRLAEAGARVVAMDLSHMFLSRGPAQGARSSGRWPHRVAGDGLQIPFGAESFDVVCLHDAVEHIADQEALWAEVVRVLRKGGHLVAVGPNLLSPLNPLAIFARELRVGRVRIELVWVAVDYLVQTMRKFRGPAPKPVYRRVDVREDLHSDADACYLASPVDIRQFLERNGCRVVRYQRGGRTALRRGIKLLTGSFAPTIWIVAVRKVDR